MTLCLELRFEVNEGALTYSILQEYVKSRVWTSKYVTESFELGESVVDSMNLALEACT